jgi:hypothetical protein
MELSRTDDEDWGPCMARLTERQRRFVIAALELPMAKNEQIARVAGYSAKTSNSLKVQAHDTFRSERVIQALHEEASKRLRSTVGLGVAVLIEIAQDKGHKDRLKAAEGLLNRIGYHELSEHKVTVDRTERYEVTATAEVLERIRKLASAAGLDPQKLPPVIDAVAKDVTEARDVTPAQPVSGFPA